MADRSKTHVGLLWTTIGLLTVLVGVTRLPAPWRMEVGGDEGRHLESWTNHYRSGDIFPLFPEKLRRMGRLSSEQLALFERVYYSSALMQCALLCLVDLHPLTWPIMAEILEATTKSNLTAMRVPSAIASVLAVLFMFLLGRELKDDAVGLWAAGLLGVCALSQVYAGQARPYALGQCVIILPIYFYVRGRTGSSSFPRRFLMAALAAQALLWHTWPIMLPFVVGDLIRRYVRGARLVEICRQVWWYVLLSMLLLLYAVAQTTNPQVFSVIGPGKGSALGMCLGSPVGGLASLGLTPLWIGSALLLVGILVGAACSFLGSGRLGSERWVLLVALAVSLLMPISVVGHTRAMTVFGIVPTVFAAIGGCWLARTQRVALGGLIVVLLVAIPMSLLRPVDPYDHFFRKYSPPSQLYSRLASELKPGDIWIPYPRFLQSNIYQCGPLPEPPILLFDSEFCEYVRHRPRDRYCLVQSWEKDLARLADDLPDLGRAVGRWTFRNGVVIIKLPPRQLHTSAVSLHL